MATIRRVFWLLFLLFCFLIITPKNSLAAPAEVLVRLDHQKVSITTDGLVCIKPSTSGTESSVQIDFPPDFILNQTTSNWMIRTDYLPADATAWPGIGSPTNISGQTIVLPSADLITGSLYCFRFEGANPLTNPSSSGSHYGGVVTTKNSTGGVVDTEDFALNILSEDQVTVSATVLPSALDFALTLQPLQKDELYNEDEILEYQIDYQSKVNYPIDLTVVGSWSLGALEGSDLQTIEILDFVPGSATPAFNNTPAVIDLSKRTISWQVKRFRGSDKVQFKLKTKKNFRGTFLKNKVYFDVLAHIDSLGVATSQQQVTQTYINSYYYRKPNPNTPPDAASIIEAIALQSLSSTEVSILVESKKKTTVTLSYGTAAKSLLTKLTSFALSDIHKIKIEKLSPNTTYYFQLEVYDEHQKRFVTDIYTFKTASGLAKADLLKNSFVITSDNVILVSPSSGGITTQAVILPKNAVFQLKLMTIDSEDIQRIDLITRNKDRYALDITSLSKLVLGTSADDSAASNIVSLLEGESGAFYGTMRVPDEPGRYDLYAKISDLKGNVSEQKICDLVVLDPFKVLESGSNSPIEKAKISLAIYNPKTRLYKAVSSIATQIKSPVYSDSSGVVDVVLPPGEYQATVTILGYKEAVAKFTINDQEGNGYPVIYMQKEALTPLSIARYYNSIAFDYFTSARVYLKELSSSNRFFDLSLLITTILFVVLSLISFAVHSHTSLRHYPRHLLVQLKNLFSHGNQLYKVRGVIRDPEYNPLANVQLFLIDQESQRVVSVATTNKKGGFFSVLRQDKNYTLSAIKKGFEPAKIDDLKSWSNQATQEIILQHRTVSEQFMARIKGFLYSGLGVLFELFLVLSLLLQIAFVSNFGLLKALPLLIISIFNIYIWVRYIYHYHYSE
jgi:hypothetical protein